MMRERNHAEFLAAQIVDDAVGKLAQWKTPPVVPPARTQLRLPTQEIERSFELREEREPEVSAAFAGVEERAFGQLPVRSGTDRRDHLIAARMRAIASAAGTS